MSSNTGGPQSPTKPRKTRAGDRLARLDELEVDIDQLVSGGDGLARFEGIPIFIPRSAPGDHLRIRLVERKPDFGRGEIVEVLKAGPGRREPPCPHFGNCGGCDLQHLDDNLQIRLKVEATLETLRRLSGLTKAPPFEVLKGSAWNYRCRTQLHTSSGSERVAVGYRSRRSHDIVEVSSCPVLVPELERLLPKLGQSLPEQAPRRLDLLVGDAETLTTAPVTPSLPHGPLEISVGRFSYELDARCFFQTHRQLLPELVTTAVGEWRGDFAVDLYAGVGLFAIPLASSYGQVVAVEGDRVAARYTRQNAKRHRLPDLKVESTAVESWIRQMPDNVDRVLVDPPRAGLSYRVRQELMTKRPKRITYVSCHVAALARDLKALLNVYRIEKMTILDMFPQTGHVEVVAQLDSIRV